MLSLPPERMPAAMRVLDAWRADPASAAARRCPACSADQLMISDRSTRPYAEWYHFSCSACGLDHTLHVPMAGPPVHGGEDG